MKFIRHWREGFPTKGVDVDLAWGEVEAVRRTNGGKATPEKIVERASDPRSPIHPIFEWDDRKAAAKYRMTTARNLIGSIEIEVIQDDGKTIQAREYGRIMSEDADLGDDGEETFRRSSYVPMTEALADPVMREQLVTRAFGELRGWQQRYRDIRSLAEVAVEVGQLIAKHAPKPKRRKRELSKA